MPLVFVDFAYNAGNALVLLIMLDNYLCSLLRVDQFFVNRLLNYALFALDNQTPLHVDIAHPIPLCGCLVGAPQFAMYIPLTELKSIHTLVPLKVSKLFYLQASKIVVAAVVVDHHVV